MASKGNAHGPSGSVIVLGAGMAGLAAALAAADAGASVVAIEADEHPGGSARWSSGRIWTLADHEALRAAAPLGDSALQRALVDGLDPALDWLAARVGYISSQPAGKSGRGRSMQLGTTGDRGAYFAAFAAVAARAGVVIHHGTRVVSASRGADGGFRVVCETAGRRREFHGAALVIATGGFQGDREALLRLIGPEAARLMLRSNPHSRGTGLRLGQALGGATSRGMAQFYGKSMPPGADGADPRRYKSLTYDVARDALAVNMEGHRFVDETSGISSEAVANAGLMQPGDHYALLLDGSQQDGFDLLGLADHAALTGRELSDLVLSSDTVDALVAAMALHWGFHATALMRTLDRFNAAAARKETHTLSPPRRGTHQGLRTAPYVALRCRPAITIPLGGLRVDAALRLCDTDLRPVAGVHVAGADAGGVYPGAYAGGLAWALVSGRLAGMGAARTVVAAQLAAQ